MNGHLSDEQWAAALLQESDEATAKHLAECSACREELKAFTAVAEAGRARALDALGQPEIFWARQRAGISTRIAGHPSLNPWRRWSWVAAAIVLIFVATSLLTLKRPAPVQTATQTDPDDALLLSVQQSIADDVPVALRPAALLTEEMVRAGSIQTVH